VEALTGQVTLVRGASRQPLRAGERATLEGKSGTARVEPLSLAALTLGRATARRCTTRACARWPSPGRARARPWWRWPGMPASRVRWWRARCSGPSSTCRRRARHAPLAGAAQGRDAGGAGQRGLRSGAPVARPGPGAQRGAGGAGEDDHLLPGQAPGGDLHLWGRGLGGEVPGGGVSRGRAGHAGGRAHRAGHARRAGRGALARAATCGPSRHCRPRERS